MAEGTLYAALAVFAINVAAFLVFGWDKWCALRSGRRVSEATLLAWAFWGGFPGAKLGQQFFRHKTRKQPFAKRLNRVGVAQALLIGVVAYYAFSERDPMTDLDTIRTVIGPIFTS